MLNTKRISLIAIATMLVACFAGNFFINSNNSLSQKNSYDIDLSEAKTSTDPLENISFEDKTFIVNQKFTSHLPIVVIDTNNVEPPINTYFDLEDLLFYDIEDIDPYVEGNMYIYNNEVGTNSMLNIPETTSKIKIKRRGNTSSIYTKAQYLIKTITESGQNNDVDILNMGEEHEWVLNGSMSDNSLIRNYLAYSTASEIFEYTPDSRYCEVFMKTEDGLRYDGVYLMLENVRQGEDRVDIEKSSSNSYSYSYIVRRDRFDENATILNTYGNLSGYYNEYISLIYPSQYDSTPAIISYVENDINTIETILYSTDNNRFSSYDDVINVDSFVDYFIFNEFFINYDAGNNSTYMYKDIGGKLSIGPVWDFDGAMDNNQFELVELDTLAFQTKPWFDVLCTDSDFVRKLEDRYIELRNSSLGEEKILNKIEEIYLYLGDSIKRDWERWELNSSQYGVNDSQISLFDIETEEGTLYRNSVYYEEEIYRIKNAIIKHGRNMTQLIANLEKSVTRDTGAIHYTKWILIAVLLAMLIPAIFVAYKK